MNIPISSEINIFQIGVGGTGSQLASNLSRYIKLMRDRGKSISLWFIDGDRYETKNMANQNISYNDIGKNKACVLADRYSAIYDIPISYVDRYVYSADELLDLISTNKKYNTWDIIIGTVDNNSTRKILNEVFDNAREIVYIDSGNGTDNMEGQVVIGAKGHSELLLPAVGQVFPSILDDEDLIENVVGCDNHAVNESPQHIATNNMAATILFSSLCNLIENRKVANHIVYFNASECTTHCIAPLKKD